MPDLIVTCPVCRNETHAALTVFGGFHENPSAWCPKARAYVDAIHENAVFYGELFIIARIDGGDPGDEQETRHG